MIRRDLRNGLGRGKDLSFPSRESELSSSTKSVAYAYGLQRMTGTKTDGEKVELWFRATACFRRNKGQWRITHMHNSVPFAMDGSDKALLDLKP
jgi:ketosteroid isomerase-like protein